MVLIKIKWKTEFSNKLVGNHHLIWLIRAWILILVDKNQVLFTQKLKRSKNELQHRVFQIIKKIKSFDKLQVSNKLKISFSISKKKTSDL